MEANKKYNGFLLNTAKDYDVPYSVVEHIYNKYEESFFYKKLEEYVLDRPDDCQGFNEEIN